MKYANHQPRRQPYSHHGLANEVMRLEAECRALKTKLEVMKQTELELTERLGDLTEKLERR